MSAQVMVVGAGLAGCEAAWQVARLGIPVRLLDMKPGQMTPAHHSSQLAELVCSNSLRASRLENAIGLLKAEMRRLGSLILAAADQTAIPAGGALAVDRERFADRVTQAILNHPLITFESARLDDWPATGDGPVIIATGPLTDGRLFQAIRDHLNLSTLHFFDAAAPIVSAESIDRTIVFRQSRYGRGGDDYLNCPLNEAEYDRFYSELIHAERANVQDFDRENCFRRLYAD